MLENMQHHLPGIQATHVYKTFGYPPTEVLRDISLEIQEGEFVALTGKSGSGKSTLLYLLSSLDNTTSGKVRIDGNDLSEMNSRDLHAFRNSHMGFVFQFHYLLPELTALENVLMPCVKSGKEKEYRERAIALFQEFELTQRLNHFPSQLSGGEQQRVAIARSLIMRPKYIFADEPTGNLDTANGQKVMELFKRANHEFNTTIIFVTHDADFAKDAHRQIVMKDGMIN